MWNYVFIVIIEWKPYNKNDYLLYDFLEALYEKLWTYVLFDDERVYWFMQNVPLMINGDFLVDYEFSKNGS
jgi:hypothetical protein